MVNDCSAYDYVILIYFSRVDNHKTVHWIFDRDRWTEICLCGLTRDLEVHHCCQLVMTLE